MSKIEFTLTVEQVLIVKQQYGEWLYHGDSSLGDHLNLHPITLEFDVPSPWRTDIENAPRENSVNILIITKTHGTYVVCPLEDLNDYLWFGSDCNMFHNNEIAYWMPIPELPKL